MIIHVYAICWNEEKMLPYFFKHYDNIADQYFIFDNDSTDNSLSMLRSHPKVITDRFEIKGNSVLKSAQDLFNQFWKKSRGKADWVIICEADEHLFHPNLRTYLQECTSKGITLVVPTGCNMVSDTFPNSNQLLYETVRYGVRNEWFDKPQIFNPNAIQEINFSPGRHAALPVGNVVKPPKSEVLLLHYKSLGLDYVNSRHSELKQRLLEGDIANGWGSHYLFDEQKNWQVFNDLKANSVKML